MAAPGGYPMGSGDRPDPFSLPGCIVMHATVTIIPFSACRCRVGKEGSRYFFPPLRPQGDFLLFFQSIIRFS